MFLFSVQPPERIFASLVFVFLSRFLLVSVAVYITVVIIALLVFVYTTSDRQPMEGKSLYFR